jgi:coenzyme PQQ synthesis protein D (PqqD)
MRIRSLRYDDVLLSQDTPVTPARHVVATRLGDELVLLDVDHGDYYSLNETAGRVWDLLTAAGNEGLTAHAAATQLGREYGNPGARVEADVCALVAHLSQARLVVAAGAKATRPR